MPIVNSASTAPTDLQRPLPLSSDSGRLLAAAADDSELDDDSLEQVAGGAPRDCADVFQASWTTSLR
jgi:hypothetical protein